MFCPKCRQEYIEGIMKCDDCNIALVDDLTEKEETQEQIQENVKFKELLRTNDKATIAFVKSILGGANIPYYTKGEIFNLTTYDSTPVIIDVPEIFLNKAKDLLKETWFKK